MATSKTPDGYVEEIALAPPAVVEVESAIPAFVGYTQLARRSACGDLLKVPTRVSSMQEFRQLFGGPFAAPITATVTQDVAGNLTGTVDAVDPGYLLYFCMEMFYANGGGPCYVVSVGDYTNALSASALVEGIGSLRNEDEPTLIVVPEAVRVPDQTACAQVVHAMLEQCAELGDRFAIIDVPRGDEVLDSADWGDTRDSYGTSGLEYAAAYYPFLRTALTFPLSANAAGVPGDNVTIRLTRPAPTGAQPAAVESRDWILADLVDEAAIYSFMRARLDAHYVVLPPSAAVAGVYARTDRERGVWKAPANAALNHVIETVVTVDDGMQAGMNVDPVGGKSINAIRSFPGKGTLLWGARTLAGNDNEWRYVPVRRLFIQMEESLRKSTQWAVFEPNDDNTWSRLRGVIENYLTQKWRDGALMGATPREAYFVRCGLGTTMDSQDLLEGRLNVEIGMAVLRPAEFIILRLSHQLQQG
jgi:phage tail sheath protein FI